MDIYISIMSLLSAGNGHSRAKDSSALGVLAALDEAQDGQKASKAKMIRSVDDLVKAGIDGIHLDILNNSIDLPCPFDPEFVSDLAGLFMSISGNMELPIEAHLILRDPVLAIDSYRSAMANMLTIPYDAAGSNTGYVEQVLKALKGSRTTVRAGVSIPATDIGKFQMNVNLLQAAEYVVIECAGKGSMDMMLPVAAAAVSGIAKLKSRYNMKYEIAAEGGITSPADAKKLMNCGADRLILGQSLFRSADYADFVRGLRSAVGASNRTEISNPYLPSRSA